MNIKRFITGIVGLPFVILAIIFGNKYFIDVVIGVVAMMAYYEYIHCISREYKSISWLGYLLCVCIMVIHLIPEKIYGPLIVIGLPTILLILFLHIILTNMKFSFKDIAINFFGICYIIGFAGFIALLYGNTGSKDMANGKYLIWYLFTCSWGTDTCAYLIGNKFGKHKFSKVSPNKSIEGCIGGALGAILISLAFTFVIQKFFNAEIYSYWLIAAISLVLSIIGQIGDFAASSIKREFKIKDFSEIFPGHGGMMDRIDSVIFIAPYAYFIFVTLLGA